jgi:hypothetical protein
LNHSFPAQVVDCAAAASLTLVAARVLAERDDAAAAVDAVDADALRLATLCAAAACAGTAARVAPRRATPLDWLRARADAGSSWVLPDTESAAESHAPAKIDALVVPRKDALELVKLCVDRDLLAKGAVVVFALDDARPGEYEALVDKLGLHLAFDDETLEAANYDDRDASAPAETVSLRAASYRGKRSDSYA